MMKKALIAGIAASALLCGAANAATLWTFTGNSAADGPVSGTALIDLTGGTLTIDLTSLLANPTSDGQELSGVAITLSSLASTSTLTSATGTEINVLSGGATSGSDNVIHHWGTALSGGSIFLATAGTGALGGKPTDLIIGPGPYTNANPSIIGKNPQILGTGHFVLTLTGLGSDVKVSGVNLGFGTTGTDYHTATCSLPGGGSCDDPGGPGTGVPEPATWAMMIMGFGGVGALLRRRRTVFA
jgi:hypothetical protein